MNDILKQRLVGALVLIGLGVIFWPVVFVESERGGLDRSPQVEPMPVLENVDIPPPRPIEDVEPVNPVQHAILPESAEDTGEEGAAEPAEPAETTDTAVTPKLDEQGIPIAWVLQVITVSSRDKAEALTAELIAEGYKAYHRSMRRDGTVLYRVYIGPVFERDKLAAVKREIDEKLKVSAIIARYVP